MTASLEKRIRGDWFDLRELSSRFFSVNEYFRFSQPVLQAIADRVRNAQQGVVALKKQIVSDVCYALDEAQFQSLTTESIGAYRREMEQVLFVGLLQRMLCLGKTGAREKKPETEVSLDDVDVKTILQDVRERVAADPEMERHGAVKAIFMQMKMYQLELRTMRELMPKLAKEKKRQVVRNFQTAADKLFEAIRRKYSVLLEEDRSSEVKKGPGRLLDSTDLEDLAPYLTIQLRHLSGIRSTLAFAEEERYQIRQMLVDIGGKRQESLEMIDRELRGYGDVCGKLGQAATDCPRKLEAEFGDELVHILERHFVKTE